MTSIVTKEELELNLKKIPRHIAIIMDGNRRWAKAHGKKTLDGHLAGAENLVKIVDYASDLGIKYLTVYSFSTENWSRPKHEVSGFMKLCEHYLKKQKKKMIEKGLKVDAIGDLTALPHSLQKTFREVKEATEKGDGLTLVLALNYGGRDEVIRAVKRMLQDPHFKQEELTEAVFSNYLDTSVIGDPEVLIRTSGELRLSNFLLWQMSYAELYVTETLWPEFTEGELCKAILEYQRRESRRGG